MRAFHIIQAVVVNHMDTVAGPDVPGQPEILHVLEQDAAVAVHDRLRQAGRPGGEEHVERVVERHRVERERPWLGEEIVPPDRVGKVVAAGDVRDVDDRLERGQRARIAATFAARSMSLSP